MRFRNKKSKSVSRFVFDRTPKNPLPPTKAPPISCASGLDNPYGRYYSSPRTREDLKKNRIG